MDLDKSLDEQIADKRKSQPRKAPRQSRERREPAPYAVGQNLPEMDSPDRALLVMQTAGLLPATTTSINRR